jgi:hypothetical protein
VPARIRFIGLGEDAMPVLKPRNRMLNVRLSDEEYDQLMRLAVAKGAHSTSELARRALTEYMARAANQDGAEQVTERIAQLEAEVKKLTRVLGTLATVAREGV